MSRAKHCFCPRVANRIVVLARCLFWSMVVVIPIRHSFADDVDARLVQVALTNGESLTGRIDELSDSLKLSSDGSEPRSIRRDQVTSITRTIDARQLATPSPQVLLVNGDVLVGRPQSVDEDSLTLLWKAVEPATAVSIPLELVHSIVVSQPEDKTVRHRLQRQWALTRAPTDRLFLLNHTYIDGELDSISEEEVVLATSLGRVATPRDAVSAISLNADLASKAEPPLDYAIVLGVEGSRITLTDSVIGTDAELTGTTLFGEQITLPIERVAGIQLFSDRVRSLAEYDPGSFEFTPYLTEEHSWERNRNVHGGPLRMRGIPYATGIGVHSKCQLRFDLEAGQYRSFMTTVGIDDMASGQGHVTCSVAVDGQIVFESGGLSGRDQPVQVGPINISQASQLTLSVDFGRTGNIRDIVNWCNPLLIK